MNLSLIRVIITAILLLILFYLISKIYKINKLKMKPKQIKNISLLGGIKKKSITHKTLHNTTGALSSNVHTPKSIYVNVPDGMILPNSTFPQVSVLTNNVLRNVPLNNFFII